MSSFRLARTDSGRTQTSTTTSPSSGLPSLHSGRPSPDLLGRLVGVGVQQLIRAAGRPLQPCRVRYPHPRRRWAGHASEHRDPPGSGADHLHHVGRIRHRNPGWSHLRVRGAALVGRRALRGNKVLARDQRRRGQPRHEPGHLRLARAGRRRRRHRRRRQHRRRWALRPGGRHLGRCHLRHRMSFQLMAVTDSDNDGLSDADERRSGAPTRSTRTPTAMACSTAPRSISTSPAPACTP